MATIGFHISQENRADDVHIDWAIVAFYEMGTAQVEDPDTKLMVDVETWDKLVRTDRSNVKLAAPDWKEQQDMAGHRRIRFTDKQFGLIQTKEQLESFCVDELDRLNGMRRIDTDADEITFTTGDRTKLVAYDIREVQRKIVPVER